MYHVSTDDINVTTSFKLYSLPMAFSYKIQCVYIMTAIFTVLLVICLSNH